MLKEPLKPIRYDDTLSEFDLNLTAPCDDRLMTKLTLDDYDWMTYTFETWLPTKKQGLLKVKVEYIGATTCTMIVTQHHENQIIRHKIIFNSDIFKDFIRDFMTKHIAQWDSTYAFCGEEEAVNFFNTILEKKSDYVIE